MVTDSVAIGFRCHSGWAVVVAVSGTAAAPVLLDRARIELVDGSLPRQPYHGVAEDGHPRTVITEVEEAATAAVAAHLRTLDRVDLVAVVAAERRLPDSLDRILAAHTLLHAAEGALYEQAVMEAAGAAAIPVHVTDPKSIHVPPAVEALGRTAGPPWRQDHKWAATAALAALAALATG